MSGANAVYATYNKGKEVYDKAKAYFSPLPDPPVSLPALCSLWMLVVLAWGLENLFLSVYLISTQHAPRPSNAVCH